jgi:acylphosphatase
VVAQGPREACEKLLELLKSGNTPGQVDKVIADWSEPGDSLSGFTER